MWKMFQKLSSIVIVLSLSVVAAFGEENTVTPPLKLVLEPNITEVCVGAEPVAITAQTSAPNLIYRWSLAGPGKIEGTGGTISYVVPQEIAYDSMQAVVMCVARDQSGQETTEIAVLTLLKCQVKSQDYARKRDRKGFFLGFGFGPGRVSSDEIEHFGDNTEGTLVDLRIGAGISEKFLLFFENVGLAISQDNKTTLSTYHLGIAGQYFVFKDAYLKLGAGLSMGTFGSSGAERDLDSGLTLFGGAGYELRLWEMFALSLGGDVAYSTGSELPGTTIGMNVGFTWYW